jgi:serine/threonine-protein kinase RsbW/stage II sporulation protein AB (anti-sigma F factor)
VHQSIEQQEAEVELRLDAVAENVGVLRQAAGAAAEAAGFPPARVEDVVLAVGEAGANVVMHAYPEDAGSFALLIERSPGELRVVVRDWGGGIAPRPESPGLGLGLPLIGSLADTVELRSGPDGQTDVAMCFTHGDGAGERLQPGSSPEALA